MSSSATGVGMPICFLGAILLILTQKSSQKFGDVLGIIVFCIKSWYDNNWIVFLQMQIKQSTNTIKTVPRCKVTKKVSKDKRFS